MLRTFALTLALGLTATAANATSLIGNSISRFAVGYTCSTSNAVVGSGIEFVLSSGGTNDVSFDFTATGLSISGTGVGAAGSSVTFVDTTQAFSGYSLASGSVAPSRFSVQLDPNGHLTFTLDRVSLYSNPPLSLNLETGAAAVPEPATWVTMLAGFGLVGGALRRRHAVVQRAPA